MFYYLLFEQLTDAVSPFNVFRYISFRSIYATVTALLIALLFGPICHSTFAKVENRSAYPRGRS